ncbi:6-carboxyhexanoate--CoA ligase [Mycobacterium sp. Root135]|uniref:acetate--CoA ligase family protein n=1 Tax=Mycobacterium sp. Root135 TaxID=1736457 RepID=UPI0006F3B268|nr:acetate--CoA ligase [Mycobacterium sp. Root135]KQY07832.1 6-carboxyhexanoate--CoA ligase [Mycobacterium sp. Root135]
MESTTRAELSTALFAPRSIALLGASSDPVKASSRPLAFLRASGYAGAVYPVNIKGGTIDGARVYPTLDVLPEVPEHAFIMTPTPSVLEAVENCGRAGVQVATILSGGFGEAGPAGQRLQDEICVAAAESGLRLLGPNSLGVVNTRNGLTLTANAAFAESDIPRGGLFAASQSGSIIGALLSRGVGRGVGFSRLVSVGAEMDLSIGEICAATLDDPEVTGYVLFLETIRHAERFRQFARGAAEREKPIVAYKLGRSAMAAQLAASHTGALAGEDDVATEFLADLGIVRVRTLDALLEGAPLVAAVPPRRPLQRRRVGVVTTTGGGAAMVVDQLGVYGVEVVGPTEQTLDRLRAGGAAADPGLVTDLTLAGTRPEIMRAALDVLTTAPEFDLVLAVVGSSARHAPQLAVAPILDIVGDATLSRHPIAAFLVPDAPQALSMLSDAGVPSFRTPEACADAIAGSLARRPARDVRPVALSQRPGHLVDETTSYEILANVGVVAARHTVLGIDDLVAGTAETTLRFPVVVKAHSDHLAHKSDVGGVVLGVHTVEELTQAAVGIRADVAHRASIALDEVLVQEMSDSVGEVLVGYRVDPVTGPLVVVAAGGALAELYADRSIRMAPLDRAAAEEMLGEIRGVDVLRGFRGGPHADLDALVTLIVNMSTLVQYSNIEEAEVNPVLVKKQGEGVVAVDAAVRVRGETNDLDQKEDAVRC